MKRLIIIGNGFDLAHGLKTSFKDFISSYLRHAIGNYFREGFYEDSLLKLEGLPFQYLPPNALEGLKGDGSFEALESLKEIKDIKIKHKMTLLEDLIQKVNELGWVDIEVEFFNYLIQLKDRQGRLVEFNSQFLELKRLLVDYLKAESEAPFDIIDQYLDFFIEPFSNLEFSEKLSLNENSPGEIYILNFNYTPLGNLYASKCIIRHGATKINYVHGSIDNLDKVVFGFGDEFDERYIEFERSNTKELYRFIKTIAYSKSKEYFDLSRFLDGDDTFQVQIFGHSCGLSDRTMLREIFENDRCKAIKLFYFEREDKSNDFEDKVIDIYRHFENKSIVKKKIVAFDYCKPMPQFTKAEASIDK